MTQERGIQFNPQLPDGELWQARQDILKTLDPFREGAEGEKLRARGLRNFYARMADPSIEFLEATTTGLASMPFEQVRQLQYASYDAGENPARFFGRYGIAVEDPDQVSAGIGNSFELIDNIVRRFDYETGELQWGEELDPKRIAGVAHERIQIRNGERQLEKMAEQVKREPDLRRRHRMGLNLKKQILNYVGSHSFSIAWASERDEPKPLTWDNLTYYSEHQSIQLDTQEGTSVGSFGLQDQAVVAEAAIRRLPFERKLDQIPPRDKERFDELRLQFGAKAANLIMLSELVPSINRLRRRGSFDVSLAVPDFQAVPVDSYRAWREGKLVDDVLQPYFEWANDLKDEDSWYSDEPAQADYIVRSSAVFSEDGENVTGAGVYESVRVYGGASFEDFKDAVTKVYASTESPQAQAYREQHGIEREEMGLVIQKFISPRSYGMHNQSQEGYMNSKLTGVPQLMEVVTGTSRNFVKRPELDFFIALDADNNENAFRNAQHFPPDQYKINPDLPIRVAQLTAVVERIWGKDIQVEFVGSGHTVNFVQVRELPASATSQAPEIQFPDELPIHTGASIGVGDMELPVLDDRFNNTEKTGAVVVQGNYMWSMGDNSYKLPREGAVIVSNDDGKNGHIQTLCAEQGLICVFPDVYDEDKPTLRYHELSGLDRVRVVSNGIEARVYKREEDVSTVNRQDEIVLYDADEPTDW